MNYYCRGEVVFYKVSLQAVKVTACLDLLKQQVLLTYD